MLQDQMYCDLQFVFSLSVASKKGPVESRELAAGKKKVLYASKRHTSTGSTVADFVTQDDNMSVTSSYIAHLQAIAEISVESDSDSD